jgi:hypothetical protein
MSGGEYEPEDSRTVTKGEGFDPETGETEWDDIDIDSADEDEPVVFEPADELERAIAEGERRRSAH